MHEIFMRTGRTLDEIHDKAESIREMLYASMEFELDREEAKRKEVARKAQQKGRR